MLTALPDVLVMLPPVLPVELLPLVMLLPLVLPVELLPPDIIMLPFMPVMFAAIPLLTWSLPLGGTAVPTG
jgi:hypothetical protein